MDWMQTIGMDSQLASMVLKSVGPALLAYLFFRSRIRREPGRLVVAYSTGAKLFCLAALIGSILLAHVANEASPGPRPWVLWFIYGWVGVGTFATLEAFRSKVWFDGDAIHHQSTFGRQTAIRVEDLRNARFGWGGNTLLIVSHHGKKIRFSALMAGSGELFRLVQLHLANRSQAE